jgi:hypothetical protein
MAHIFGSFRVRALDRSNSAVSVAKADLRAAFVAKADLSGAHLRTWALFPLHKRT